ncbi:MAG: hypothetical protein ACRCUE_07715 [Bosea sp. (in: a-proteobacteria)]
MRGYLVLLSMIAGVMMTAPSSARSLDDCEKIKDWHAYNTCLASFGPRRGQRSVSNQPQAAGPEGRVYGRSKQVQRRAIVPGLNVQRVSGGRVRATFDVSGPRRARTQ